MNKWWRRFSLENILMSVCGHLFLVAAVFTSVSLVMERARLVTPDRIQILEIDLDDVVVSGKETKLYNVGTPDVEKKQPEKTSKTVNAEVEKTEIKTTTLVEDLTKGDNLEKLDEKSKEQASEQPKKKRVVRVNREVLSLDRSMTVSVVDAMRVAMTRCWVIDSTRPDIADIRAVAHLTMRKNGTVQNLWFESAARAETDAAFAYVLETIKSAINTCQPFRMLPANEFDSWKKIQLTFYPTQGKVM